MVRKIPLFLACLAAAAPALAAAPHYRAEPLAAPAADRLVVRGTAWRCDAAACTAPAINSRPALVCEMMEAVERAAQDQERPALADDAERGGNAAFGKDRLGMFRFHHNPLPNAF